MILRCFKLFAYFQSFTSSIFYISKNNILIAYLGEKDSLETQVVMDPILFLLQQHSGTLADVSTINESLQDI